MNKHPDLSGPRLGDVELAHSLDIVPRQDRSLFVQLKDQVSAPETRFNRNSTLNTLKNQLTSIRQFCVRHDCNDWRRCQACGICWLDDEHVAMNTQQLGWLVGKSKSTLNANLILMKYIVVPSASPSEAVEAAMPGLKGKVSELRHWMIRRCPIVPCDVKSATASPERQEVSSPVLEETQWEFVFDDQMF
jgi:hypothetical protein